MNEGKISKRYAKALLLYAQEMKSEDLVFEQMKKIVETYRSHPKFKLALKNPMLRSKDKIKILDAVFDNKPGPTLSSFFNLLLTNKREKFLLPMALMYIELYRQSKNMVLAKLVTAVPANERIIEQMKALSSTIVPGTLSFETVVDKDIDGGFILYVDTYRVDASVSNQLRRIKQQFVSENT